MASTIKNKKAMWIVFFLFTALLIWAVGAHWPWLTLLLPFVTTSFVLAMDII